MTEWFKNIVRKIRKGFAVFFGGAGGSYTPVPTLEASCVAMWNMDETGGTTIKDYSGNGNDGTSERDTSLMTVAGKINTALKWVGGETIDFITIPNSSSVEIIIAPLSIFMWIKPGNQYECWVLQKGSRDLGGNLHLQYALHQKEFDESNIYFACYLEDGQYGYTSEVPVGEWSHIGFVWNGTQIIYYLNGQETGATGFYSGNLTSRPDFFIGKGYYSGAQIDYYNGTLDDVRIFNRAITQEEIDFLYNGGNGREGFMLNQQFNMTGTELLMSGV